MTIMMGHRIPVYYHKKTNKIFVSEKKPKDIKNYFQDDDVLDTWFSLGLWLFLLFVGLKQMIK